MTGLAQPLDHRARRADRDLMLGAPASEDDSDVGHANLLKTAGALCTQSLGSLYKMPPPGRSFRAATPCTDAYAPALMTLTVPLPGYKIP